MFNHRIFYGLLGSHTESVTALCNGHRVCRLSVPRQISKTSSAKFHLYRKSGSPSKNMTSYFHRKWLNTQQVSCHSNNFGSVRAYCFPPLAMQVVLKTSIMSPCKRLHFRVGRFKWISLYLYCFDQNKTQMRIIGATSPQSEYTEHDYGHFQSPK